MHFHRIIRKRAEVPIVPMIDILFILLVYLVVTTEARKPITEVGNPRHERQSEKGIHA